MIANTSLSLDGLSVTQHDMILSTCTYLVSICSSYPAKRSGSCHRQFIDLCTLCECTGTTVFRDPL